jgi:multidrug transporter EmrE-like cation transporter
VLGVVNYASLLLLVMALGKGELPASLIFPLMNIGAILFATGAGILLFRERLTRLQWTGVALCVLALALMMLPSL